MSKPTHLLIPIEEFESIRPETYHKRPTALKAAIFLTSKQISFSLEDIKKKAEDKYPLKDEPNWYYSEEYTERELSVEVYEQALKDLLNQ